MLRCPLEGLALPHISAQTMTSIIIIRNYQASLKEGYRSFLSFFPKRDVIIGSLAKPIKSSPKKVLSYLIILDEPHVAGSFFYIDAFLTYFPTIYIKSHILPSKINPCCVFDIINFSKMWNIQMKNDSNVDYSQPGLNLFGDDESRPMNMSSWSIFCDQREEPLDGLAFFSSFRKAQERQRSLEDDDEGRSPTIPLNSCFSTSHEYTTTESFLVHIQPNQVQHPVSLHSLPKKRSRCNCSKSRCNKDYCECYQNGEICSIKTCGCMHCENVKETQVHRERLRRILSPERKGCTCKRNQCSKRYCDCKKVGDHCGPECGCIGCQNKEDSEAKRQQRSLRKIRDQIGKRVRQ